MYCSTHLSCNNIILSDCEIKLIVGLLHLFSFKTPPLTVVSSRITLDANTLPVGSVSNSFTITKYVLELTVEPILARFLSRIS